MALVTMTAPAAHAETAQVRQVIGGFETGTEGWRLGLGQEFPGARGDFRTDTADPKVGARSALFAADFSGGGHYVSLARDVDLDPSELRLWIKATNITHLGLRVTDRTGQVHQQAVRVAATGQWEELIVTAMNSGEQYFHFGGANDGEWHGPAQRVMFLIDKIWIKENGTRTQVRLDEVALTGTPPDLALRQTRPGNVFTGSEPAEFTVHSRGDVRWTVYDLGGAQVAAGWHRDPASPLRVPVDRVGHYRLELVAELDGAVLARRSTTFARLAPFDLSTVEDSPFGMSAHLAPDGVGLGILDLARKAGVKNLRDDLAWNRIEPVKGQYTKPASYQAYVAALRAQGQQLLPIADYTNPHYDNNATPYTDAGRAGFANYAAQIPLHYGDRVKWLEVYNEFNIPNFGDIGNGPADSRADYYYPLLKATYEKIKATTPEVTVVGAATARVPLDWLEQLFQLGGLRYMDAVSVHPYVYPAEPEEMVQSLVALRELIKKYNSGRPKPIWITEQGWPTNVGGSGVSEGTQAANIVRTHVLALANGVERFFWYDLMNDGVDPTYNEHNFGILRNESDPAGTWTPKPAYVSYAAMTRQLTGARFIREESIADGVHSVLFAKDAVRTRVLWSTRPATVAVRTDRPITITDLTGHETRYEPGAGGQVHLSLSGDPIYVTGGEDAKVTEAGRFRLSTDNNGRAWLGSDIALTLTVDNTAPPRNRVDGVLTVADRSFPVQARPGEQVTVPVRLPGQDVPGSRTVEGDLIVDGKRVGRLVTRVEVSHPVRLDARHIRKADGAETLAVTMANAADQEIALGALTWRIGERSGSQTPPPLPAASSRVVELPLAGLATPGTHPLHLRLAVNGLPDLSYTGTVATVPASALHPAARRTITVDGALDDLAQAPRIDLVADGQVKIPSRYEGAHDLSGNVWLTWDDQFLYLSARVSDNQHVQSATGDQIFTGDSIQLAIGAGLPGESEQWYEYGVARTPEGPQVYRWLTAGDPAGPVTGLPVAVHRNDQTQETTYELALPWDQIRPALPADGQLSVSMLVNDNDGLGREGYIEWGSGIGSAKDPALFKPVRLLPGD
ncbi:sugar-binding protein [Micromonospora sp. NPDC000018]|uniref:sugar-binding protein n=1 Tax=Micromonospora sp. NPDC000018 TaxID=3154239 RepID=UPI003316A076